MAPSAMFYVMGLAFILHITAWINIVSFLQKRGVKINFFLMRILIIKYVNQYKAITTEETGRPGPWFGIWIASINLLWTSAFFYFIIR